MSLFLGITAAMGVLMLIAVAKAACRIEEGHAGVLTSLGRIRLGSDKNILLLGPGFHWKRPWEKLHEFSTMERVLGVREDDREVELLTRDGTLIRLDPQVRFSFNPERMTAFVFGIKRPMSHLRELFRGLMSEEIGRFGSENSEDGSFAEIRRQRKVLNTSLEKKFRDDLAEKYGVTFKAVEIAEILPPAELAQALNSVQKIEVENKTLLHRVSAECEQRVTAAEHGVHIEKMRAQAVEKEIAITSSALEQLQRKGVLTHYVKHRRDEATSLSKTLYLKSI